MPTSVTREYISTVPLKRNLLEEQSMADGNRPESPMVLGRLAEPDGPLQPPQRDSPGYSDCPSALARLRTG